MNYKKFQTMSKEEYYKKYNIGVRFLFGYDKFSKCRIWKRIAILWNKWKRFYKPSKE